MPSSILIVDDEPTLARNISRYLDKFGYATRTVGDADGALQAMDDFRPDLVLLDVTLPDIDGLELLRRVRARDRDVKVVMITGHGSIQIAVDAMKTGAEDFLTKPLVLADLKRLIDKIVGQQRLEGVLAYYRERDARGGGVADLIGESAEMRAVRSRIQQVIDAERQLSGNDPPPVLITGETGTGKELVARALHFGGARRNQPFVEINCASVPPHLMEAELFGYERGAFTDAKSRKIGLMESADGGSLFLDEIGDMDLALQAKLLKVIEDKRVRRLGGLRDQRVNVRLIAATNQNLDERVGSGAFRADLLFRLRVVHVALPPLRDRDGDVVLLAEMFLGEQQRRYGKPGLRFGRDAKRMLCDYGWPGNVRELRNVIEHAVLICRGTDIAPEHLGPLGAPSVAVLDANTPNGREPATSLPQMEIQMVRRALDQTGWNVTQAARLLGVTRDTLRYRIEKNNLRRPN